MINKSLIVFTVGSIVLAIISFLKLNEFRQHKKKKNKKPQAILPKNEQEKIEEGPTLTPLKIGADYRMKELYGLQLKQQNLCQLIANIPKFCKNIVGVVYKIVLSLNKDVYYDGVVQISIQSLEQKPLNQDLMINFQGSILYIEVNGEKLEQSNIIYRRNQITIKKEQLRHLKNHIEIAFSNKYAFVESGLVCYFPLSQNKKKYSLRGQTLYTINGAGRAGNIFPCLNLLNPCRVQLEVLHSSAVTTESNTKKLRLELASKQEYSQYPFLFEKDQNSLASPRKLNTSRTTDSSFSFSVTQSRMKSQFSESSLSSIHAFFLLSRSSLEVRPVDKSLKLVRETEGQTIEHFFRYFIRESYGEKVTSFISMLHVAMQQILKRVGQISVDKVDVFFIEDENCDGDFYAGSILLSEKWLLQTRIIPKLKFLLCRSLIGMRSQSGLLRADQLMVLNEQATVLVPECSDFVFLMDEQYGSIREEIIRTLQDQNQQSLFWLLEYYSKECKFIVQDHQKLKQSASPLVKDLVKFINSLQRNQFWSLFLQSNSLLGKEQAETLLKMALRAVGLPQLEAHRNYCKQHFVQSKYYLSFFLPDEIQRNLRQLLHLKCNKIEKVIGMIKVRESTLDDIPTYLQSFLATKQNKEQCRQLHEQFKSFNEIFNFHHRAFIKAEIKKIRLLLDLGNQRAVDHNIEYKDIVCGVQGWKLLQKLNIYPAHEPTRNLLAYLNGVKQPMEKQFRRLRANTWDQIQEEVSQIQKLLSTGED